MKFLVLLAVAVACVAADVSHIVPSADYNDPIVRSTYEINPEGTGYQFAYETGNGIYAQAEGLVKNANSDTPVHEVKGGYKYTSPDGTPVDATYIADDNGFRVTGSHVHPIPDAILRSLEYIRTHAPVPEGRFTKP